MGKMVDKDELEFLRKMSKEGNLESNLNKSNPKVDALRRMVSERSITAGSNIDKALGSKMASPAQMSMLKEASKKAGKSGLLKGLGRAASLAAGPVLGLASQVAEASPIDKSSAEFDPITQEANKEKMIRDEKLLQNKRDVTGRSTHESLQDAREWTDKLKQDYLDRNMNEEEQDAFREEQKKQALEAYLKKYK